MNAQYEDKLPFDPNSIFSIKDLVEFNNAALAVFRFQLKTNAIYREYCEHLKVDVKGIEHYSQIPFLPIEFFKTKEVTSFTDEAEIVFTSSGTTGDNRSMHFVKDLTIYENSFIKAFELNYGSIQDYVVLGLLPSYLEREGSSLIYMVERFIKESSHTESGFFLDDYEKLNEVIKSCKGKNILLIGVTYALLDFGEKYHPDLSGCIIMETGGMKGKRKEMIKSELHDKLNSYFGSSVIHSEYGMTELLSQAYSRGLQFKCPPWMKVLTRSCTDPLSIIDNKTGGINVIDLANLYSCSFIATQDLGKVHENYFEVLGRFDNSDIRGCNLLVQ